MIEIEFEEIIKILEDECVEFIERTETEVHIYRTEYNEMLVNRMNLEKPKFKVVIVEDFLYDKIIIRWKRFLNGWW